MMLGPIVSGLLARLQRLSKRYWAIRSEYGVVVHVFRTRRAAEKYLTHLRRDTTPAARRITEHWTVAPFFQDEHKGLPETNEES